MMVSDIFFRTVMAREDFDCYVGVKKEKIGMIDTVLFRAKI
jgi:hypothetical protein